MDVGTVRELWRFPVKSMQGERLDAAALGVAGLLGDRAYAIVDRESGKVASAKNPKRWPQLLDCRANFTRPPQSGEEVPPVQIELADGTSVTSDARDVDAVLSRFFGREVRLARTAPADFTIEQYHPDIENLDPNGRCDEVADAKLGSDRVRQLGIPLPPSEASFKDAFPVSVISTSTLNRVGEVHPGSLADIRRFRMNLLVETDQPGFVENGWLGRTAAVGDDVRLMIAIPNGRCVMTIAAQPGLPHDSAILRALAEHNRLDVPGRGLYPCAGVYAVTETGGTIRTSDPVRVP
jgi:uncharacterized protein YcbX